MVGREILYSVGCVDCWLLAAARLTKNALLFVALMIISGVSGRGDRADDDVGDSDRPLG